MKYLIGLDIGTSAVKGVLMTEDGIVSHTASSPFVYTQLENGGVEIEAEKFTESCFSAIKTLANGADGEICGICASSASGNLLILDKENKPITQVFNWQDKRVTTESEEILGSIDKDALYRKIGWGFSGKGFPLALLCYVKKHFPEKIESCGKVCMSTEYLYYILTGRWGISSSAGTPFYLIDQNRRAYIPELLSAIGITEENLPPIMPCGSKLGGVTKEASEICGLPLGTPVVLGSFDHPSAARGVGVFNEGEMLLSCGTSWVGFFPVNDRKKAADAKILIDPFLSEKGGAWGTMVSVASLSGYIDLYIKRYIDDSENRFDILTELARKSSLGANGLSICLTDDPDDKKISSYDKSDIARAIVEGAVILLKKKLDILADTGISPKTAVMVGGPSKNPLYLEIIEEICGIKVKVCHGVNAGAVGAAMLAGIGAGLYKDEKEANRICNERKR